MPGQKWILIWALTFILLIILVVHWKREMVDLFMTSRVQKLNQNSNNREVARRSHGKCTSGYLQGFPPICGADGCLPILSKPLSSAKVSPMDARHVSAIDKMQGWMFMGHVDLIQLITHAQREFGIFGSVGEIGVYHGRYTAILSYWLDRRAGERLFVCDIFGRKPQAGLKTEDTNLPVFEKNMNKMGYSVFSKREDTLIRTWNDSSLYLSKHYFLTQNLHAFRLFSVDGNHNKPFPLQDLLLVSCLLRPGSIIAVDDFSNTKWPDVAWSVHMYMKLYGSEDKIKPLALLAGKLYLVTGDYHEKYMEWLGNNLHLSKLKLQKQKGHGFSKDFEFFVG